MEIQINIIESFWLLLLFFFQYKYEYIFLAFQT